MTKREQKRLAYTEELKRERIVGEHRAAIFRMGNALFATIQMAESPALYDWHKLVSDCRNTELVDASTVEFVLGKRATWRTEAEWNA